MLMTHIYFGDPTKKFSLKLAKTLAESGADMLEIGIPYTDPVCDGEVFQQACKRALLAGITPDDVFEGIKHITLYQSKHGTGQAIYLTSYYAPIFKIGVNKFVQKAKSVGVKGLIIPDLLLEEQDDLRKACDTYGLSLIQFATVYSTKERLRQIIDASTDFIYCVSLPGVTGDTRKMTQLHQLLQSLRNLTDLPRRQAGKKLFVGFGIASQKDVREIIGMGADGVIVGSAIARLYEKNISNPTRSLSEIKAFVNGLKESILE
jgi:tryptophan synthase alpha chain